MVSRSRLQPTTPPHITIPTHHDKRWMWQEERRADDIVASDAVAVVSDAGLIEETCRTLVAAYPDEVARYKAGQTKLLGFLVGKGMKEMAGNPSKTANGITLRLLGG